MWLNWGSLLSVAVCNLAMQRAELDADFPASRTFESCRSISRAQVAHP